MSLYHILSATQSGSLFTWLNDSGYQVPGQSQDLLQQYIDGHTFGCKVAADAGVESGDKLSPLQFAYTSDAFQIPIRIGTLNAKEAQDLVVYAVSTIKMVAVGYQFGHHEFSMNNCMGSVDNQSFGITMPNILPRAGRTEDGAWTVEYAGWRRL